MANIIEKTGKSYNIFDKINNVWNKCSFWTHSNDVFYPDGKSATTKHGAIDGITSDLSGESENIAASIKCVNQINSSLTKKYAVLSGTTPTNELEWSNDISYPIGFNKNNTLVLASQVFSESSWFQSSNIPSDSLCFSVGVRLKDSGISIRVLPGNTNLLYKVLLMRDDI